MLEVKKGNVVQVGKNWNLRRGTLKNEAAPNKPDGLLTYSDAIAVVAERISISRQTIRKTASIHLRAAFAACPALMFMFRSRKISL